MTETIESDNPEWIEQINWGDSGLIPAIAQEAETGRVLSLAWMNRTALALTAAEGRAVYWSRSRQELWRKGERSGHVQMIEEIRTDCDRDTILLTVRQQGGIACHTGRHSCFYERLDGLEWHTTDPVLRRPEDIYGDG